MLGSLLQGHAGIARVGLRGVDVDLFGLAVLRTRDLFEGDGGVLVVRLLAYRIPLEEGQFVRSTRVAGRVPVAEVKWQEELARGNLADSDLRVQLAAARGDAQPVAFPNAELYRVVRAELDFLVPGRGIECRRPSRLRACVKVEDQAARGQEERVLLVRPLGRRDVLGSFQPSSTISSLRLVPVS